MSRQRGSLCPGCNSASGATLGGSVPICYKQRPCLIIVCRRSPAARARRASISVFARENLCVATVHAHLSEPSWASPSLNESSGLTACTLEVLSLATPFPSLGSRFVADASWRCPQANWRWDLPTNATTWQAVDHVGASPSSFTCCRTRQ